MSKSPNFKNHKVSKAFPRYDPEINLTPLQAGLIYHYYKARRLLSVPNLFRILILIFFLLGLFSREIMILAISLFAFYAVTYQVMKKISNEVKFEVLSPEHGIEDQEIEIDLVVSNYSSFTVHNLFGRLYFKGAHFPFVPFDFDRSISLAQKVSLKIKLACDGGMGEKPLGPLIAVISDPLGLVSHQVEIDLPNKIKVIPKEVPHNTFPTEGASQSYQYGHQPIVASGISPTFLSIREYVRGDSIRHIDWKTSAKMDSLYVKEFERTANSSISVLLDLSEKNHVGFRSLTSWQALKSIALNFVSYHINQGDQVQLFSPQYNTDSGTGSGHHSLLRNMIWDQKLSKDTKVTDLIQKAKERTPYGSSVVVFTTDFCEEEFGNLIAQLSLRKIDLKVYIIDTDPIFKNADQNWITTSYFSESFSKISRTKTFLHRNSSLANVIHIVDPITHLVDWKDKEVS